MEKEEIIFGRNPVLEYLKSLFKGDQAELYIYSNAHGKIIDKIISEAKSKKIPFSYKDKNFFSDLASSSEHQGVILKISQPLLGNPSKNQLLKNTAENKGILILLDRLTDPHNVGSIIRSAEALGAEGVIITKSHSSGITPTVIKSSAGATAYIDILSVSNISGFLESAKKYGFWIIGTDREGESEISRLKGIRPALIVVGSEGTGTRKIIKEKCDYMVKIPLRGKISSLNASVAAGIIIYELING